MLDLSYLPLTIKSEGVTLSETRPVSFPVSASFVILQACYDLPAFDGHLDLKAKFDRAQDSYFSPRYIKISKLIAQNMKPVSTIKPPTNCKPPVPTRHAPVQRPFQRLAINFDAYKPPSNGFNYVPSIIITGRV